MSPSLDHGSEHTLKYFKVEKTIQILYNTFGFSFRVLQKSRFTEDGEHKRITLHTNNVTLRLKILH